MQLSALNMVARVATYLFIFSTSLAQECGKPAVPPPTEGNGTRPRIINGEEAIPHSFPWMASIEGDLVDQHYCGASIISPQWAVTAGHCGEIIYIGIYSGDEIALGLHDRREQEGGKRTTKLTKNVTPLLKSKHYEKWMCMNNNI